MRDFTKVSNSIWNSTKFNSLVDDRHKLAYLYMLTCPHSNSSGCYTLKKGYAAADLGWPIEGIGEAIESLKSVGLIDYDEADQTVLLVNWVSFNPPTNAKHALGILGHLKAASSKALKLKALQEFSDCIEAKGFNRDRTSGEALVKAIGAMFKAYGKGIATETETETESRPDQDTDGDLDSRAPARERPAPAAATPNGASGPSQELLDHLATRDKRRASR